MDRKLTLGEVLAGRVLEVDKRFGVPHYKPGQHSAVLKSHGLMWLTYCDEVGHACLVVCEKRGQRWAPVAKVRSGHEVCTGVQPADDFILSDKMKKAIEDGVKATHGKVAHGG